MPEHPASARRSLLSPSSTSFSIPPATPASSLAASNKQMRQAHLLQTQLNPLLQQLLISQWDALLIGDGSGSGWNVGCGWASTLFDRRTGRRKLFYGGANQGTAMLGELLTTLVPLEWYAYHRQKKGLHGQCHIHVITDNQAMVTQGQTFRKGNRPKTNRPYWAAVGEMEHSYRFVTHYHWLRRATLGANQLADVIAGNARVAMTNLQIPGAVKPMNEYVYSATVDDCPEVKQLHRP